MFANLPTNAIADGCLSWDDPEVQNHIARLNGICEWYEDEEGFLYIADPEADGLIHGPDNDKTDAMYGALRGGAPFHRLDEYVDGLTYICHVLRRFSPEDGLYHA